MILTLIELVAYIAYIFLFVIQRRQDRDSIRIRFILSCTIVVINAIQLIFMSHTGQNVLSMALSVLVIFLFGFDAKNCYDQM